MANDGQARRQEEARRRAQAEMTRREIERKMDGKKGKQGGKDPGKSSGKKGKW